MNGGVWTVFEEMDRLRRDLDRVLGGTRSGRGDLPSFGVAFLPAEAPRAYPLVNIHDDPERYRVDCLAPGLDPDAIEISVTGSQIALTGRKTGLDQIPAERWHRVERATGHFQRTINLPGEIDRDGVAARYRDGILSISVPKAEKSRPKSIPVTVA